jgi:hypothetical protein
MVYNIPVILVEAYHGRRLIVRSQHPSELVERLSEKDLENLSYIQLFSLTVETDPLTRWGEGIPVELVMQDPKTEFPLLYKHAKLFDTHPIRVAIPVAPGFSKAVKLAVPLNFAVKLEVTQPDSALMEEMSQVLSFYLHHSTASEPIEYFHSLLLAFYHQNPVTLWTIQEEDPAYIRYITDQGEETLPPRLAGTNVRYDLDSFLEAFKKELLAEKGECYECEFFENCGGYFKWPQKAFSCEGVKTLFRTLKEAAGELRKDLNSFPGSRREKQP